MVNTELSKRKLDVLSAIVKAYIETGEPISSKNLATLLDNAPSSATLRNEMNALCSLGLLSQPHTSAGRIPTSSGYQLYINLLMQPLAPMDNVKQYINSRLSGAGCDTQSIPRVAADALATLTGYPAISCYIVKDDTFLKHVRLLPLSKKSAMIFLLASDGRTRSTICHIPTGLTADMTEKFLNIVKSKLIKRPLCEMNKAYLQSVIAAAGINSLVLAPIITNLFDMASALSESSVALSNASALFDFCNDEDVRKIISLTERTEQMIEIIGKDEKKSNIIFGNDTDFIELKNKVMVVSKYNCKNSFCGKIGIIGPDRMFYDRIIPSIEYISSKLTALMTDAASDMED